MDIDNARGWLLAPNPNGIDPDPEVTAEAVEAVLVRLAELEAGEVTTEWAVRWPSTAFSPGGEIEPRADEHDAEVIVGMYPDQSPEVVSREVRRGAWTAAEKAAVERDDQIVEALRVAYGPGKCACSGRLPVSTHSHGVASCVAGGAA